jgi:cytochrome P450
MTIEAVEAPGMPTFPMKRTCPFRPPARYDELRAQDPVSRVLLPNGKHAWLITSHAYARQLLVDDRLSSRRTHPGFPELVPGLAKMASQSAGFMSWMDGQEHAGHRRLVTGEFTVRRVQDMRPRIQEITDAAITELLDQGPPADLVRSVSLPVPSLVICDLLGVPYADRDFFQERTRTIADRNCDAAQRGGALGELRGYLSDLVTVKETEPADDVLSRLIAKYRNAGTYDHDHVAGTAVLLLIAGHESTANMISLGTVALLENPEQLARLSQDPGRIRGTVEELLRFFSISDPATSRVAVGDITIGGHTIRAGEGVIIPNAAANWDPGAFAEPERLDIDREARQHIAFGYGAHQCLGQNLARAELEIVYSTLFTRVPGLRLAVRAEELPFKDDANIYGINAVPVTW